MPRFLAKILAAAGLCVLSAFVMAGGADLLDQTYRPLAG